MTSKEKVLEFLESNKDSYISGEAMAKAIGLSRNAIWKAINELRKAGYSIDAVSNKGYMLSQKNDILSSAGIYSYLTNEAKSIFVNQEDMLRIYDTTISTNRLAKEQAIAGAKHGTVILSKEQSEGRGRLDHSFFSPNGGIYMSIIMTPNHLPFSDPKSITAFTGVSVCDAINELTGINPKIKPVNDLFVDGKKICGILVESGAEFETGHLQWIVIGIGINFDSDIMTFPEELREVVGSLFAPGQATITKNQLAATIISKLLAIDSCVPADIINEYNNRLISI